MIRKSFVVGLVIALLALTAGFFYLKSEALSRQLRQHIFERDMKISALQGQLAMFQEAFKKSDTGIKNHNAVLRAMQSRIAGKSLNRPVSILLAFQKIDTSDCPPDFVNAWRYYLSAYEKKIDRDNSRGLFSNSTEDARFQIALDDSWTALAAAATKYGVNSER